MKTQTNYIVFLCYGNERVFHECTYSLLSLSRLYAPAELNNTGIWIYTDNPGWFRAVKGCTLPLHYREVDTEIIKQWRGKIDFVHRVKVEMLRDFVKDKNGNILYVDTDVVFTHRIDKMLRDIGAGALYMHTLEGIVNRSPYPLLKKLNKYLHTSKKINDRPLYDMAMWNAGVLGFNTKYNYLLENVLTFTDAVFPKFSKHIVEQFAFSVYFQQSGVVKAAAPYIFHYWKLKEATQVLEPFFRYFKDKTWQELIHYGALVQMHALMQEKVAFYHNRGAAGAMLNKQWAPKKPDWAELEKQLYPPEESGCTTSCVSS